MDHAEKIVGIHLYNDVPLEVLRHNMAMGASLKRDALKRLFQDLEVHVRNAKEDPYKGDEDAFLQRLLNKVAQPIFGVCWPAEMDMLMGKLVKIPGGIRTEGFVPGFSFLKAREEGGLNLGVFVLHEQDVFDELSFRAGLADHGMLTSEAFTDEYWFYFNARHTRPFVHLGPSLAVCEGPWWQNEDQLYAEEYSKEVAELDKTSAGARAVELLWGHLTPEQRRSWIKTRSFTVTKTGPPPGLWRTQALQKTRRRNNYRFHKDRLWTSLEARRYVFDGTTTCGSVNAFTYDGQFLFNACSHPGTPFPTGDALLAMKLELERDEKEFLRTSNLTNYGANEEEILELKGFRFCV